MNHSPNSVLKENEMRVLQMMVVISLSFAVVAFQGQSPIAKPTNEEAKSACLTLEHLLVIARDNNQVQDASALSGAYKLVRAGGTNYYVHDLGGTSWYGPPPSSTLGRALDMFPSDPVHQSGVLVYGKNGSVENLHLQADPDSVTRLLKNNGAVIAEPPGF
jgi:hypothetical protein